MSSFWLLCSEFYLIVTHILLSLCIFHIFLIDHWFYSYISHGDQSPCVMHYGQHWLSNWQTLSNRPLIMSVRESKNGFYEVRQWTIDVVASVPGRQWENELSICVYLFLLPDSGCSVTGDPLSCLHFFPLDQTIAAAYCKLCFFIVMGKIANTSCFISFLITVFVE